jgi:hypothetical protein
MDKGRRARVGIRAALAVAALALGASAAPSGGRGGGGAVQPPDRNLLSQAASVTADFNVGGGTAPNVPYEILAGGAGDFTATPQTSFYVPIFFADDAPPLSVPNFPGNLKSADATTDYLIDAIDEFAGVNDVVATYIEVDGKVTVLGNPYTVGVDAPSLADGGRHYIVSAVFLSPLSPGTHTIGIGAVLSDGTQIGPPGYTVTVK